MAASWTRYIGQETARQYERCYETVLASTFGLTEIHLSALAKYGQYVALQTGGVDVNSRI